MFPVPRGMATVAEGARVFASRSRTSLWFPAEIPIAIRSPLLATAMSSRSAVAGFFSVYRPSSLPSRSRRRSSACSLPESVER